MSGLGDMNSDDELLDEIAAYLRHEPVPAMPDRLITKSPPSPRGWPRLAAGALALAASLCAILLWRSASEPGTAPQVPSVAQPAQPSPPDTGIVVLDADLVQPLIQIEAGLNWIDVELAQLRRDASRLDARRMADQLLAQF